MATQTKAVRLPDTRDEAFVRDTYRLLLGREPDKEGIRAHLDAMSHGVSRERLFFEVRVSPEGCRTAVPVEGLRIGSIRAAELLALDGVCFADGLYLALLGRTPGEAEMGEVLKALTHGTPRESLCGAAAQSKEAREVGTVLTGLRRAQASRKVKNVLSRVPVARRVVRRLDARPARSGGPRRGVSQVQHDTLARRVRLLEEDDGVRVLTREVEQLRGEVQALRLQLERRDSLAECAAFRAFRDARRGSREEVLARLSLYDGVIGRVRRSGGELLSAVDLGCGRGEWLEKLSGLGFSVLGVDVDDDALATCEERGLLTARADLTAWLRNCASASVDLLSLFRVAEYLPAGTLAEVLTECGRVLRPGGALIVETLNPEHPAVAAGGFALDPTRVTPLPPALLEALVKGCVSAETARLPEEPCPEVYAVVAFRQA